MSEGNITRRGKKSWRLKFDTGHDESGKRLTKFKTVRGSKTDAQKELRRLLGQVDNGTFADPGKLTLGDYLDQWLHGHRGSVSPRTAERYAEQIDNHIKPAIGEMLLGQLRTLDLNKLYADKLASGRLDGKGGLSARSVHHLDRLLHTALEDAVRGNLIVVNPVNHAKRPKVEKAPPETLSDDDFSALLEKAKGGRLYTPILMILATGLRRGELLALRWRNVNLDTCVTLIVEAVEETKAGLRIKPAKTDSGNRRVDLPAFAVQALREHQLAQKKEHMALGLGWSADTLVFPSPLGGVQRPRNFTKSVTRQARSAGIRFTPHLGRHDHFTRLLAAGLHPKIAQIRAGHSSIAVTMDIYSHVTDGLQREATERIENAFGALTKV
jgi:integrase